MSKLMSLNYDLDTHLKALETVLDEYTEWFLQVTRLIFYPAHDHNGRGQVYSRPQSFEAWAQAEQNSGSIKPGVMNGIRNLHGDLTERADVLINESLKTKAPPPYDEYHKLSVLFEEFTGHMRRLEEDMLLEDSGVDALTGLRSKDVMEKDIKREMDRLARQGKAFAVALVRIDNFEGSGKTQDESDECVKSVAEMIKRSMRSFDDAYRLDEGMFVLSLKQTGTSGGIRALKRLRNEIDKTNATQKVNGQVVPLSFSSCIGEPSEAEDILAFLENLKKYLASYKSDEGSVLEYFELSPLQRYIREKDQERG